MRSKTQCGFISRATCKALASAFVLLLVVVASQSAQTQTFKTRYSFCSQNNCTDGAQPYARLVQAINGTFYGTTSGGGSGSNAAGTVFKITPSGTLTTLYSFSYSQSQNDWPDGDDPAAGLVQATDGNLYGTAYEGGANSVGGTVFKITPSGTLTTLYSFCSQSNCTDGWGPYAGLVQATNGNFYGTTYFGGASNTCTDGCGTVFKITPRGTLTTLHSFDATDGYAAYPGPLVQATNGDLYGTTDYGGTFNDGTVFKITPSGTLTTLHSFDGTDGAGPQAGLVQATNGNLYGTTAYGGTFNLGTVFKITPSGTLTTLLSFAGGEPPEGAYPLAGLVQATDGNFYGSTYEGGSSATCTNGCGTVFKITPSGKLTTLHSFDGTDGDEPTAGLVQVTNGNFYGTTYGGGANNYGTVFSLSVGLGPFVETLPTSGKVGASVKILGTKLTGATSVTFNGKAAVFKVVSGSEITTTVPTGATTGKVKVITPGGTLTSNVNFRVP